MDDIRRPTRSFQGPTEPLISCIMPTTPGREYLAAMAIQCFERQTYRNTELIVVRDEGMSLGEKRNLACQRARGEYIAHWDDDDWSDPRRLQIQCAALTLHPVVGFRSMWFYDVRDHSCWHYDAGRNHGIRNYALGTSLCYRRDYWRKHPFPDRHLGEDWAFQWQARASGQIACCEVAHLMVARRHGQNTCRWEKAQHAMGIEWRKAELAELPDQFLADSKLVVAA